jgi:hypothetical protein
MGAEEKRRKAMVSALAPSDDVGRGVGPDLEPRLAHPRHRELPRLAIGFAEGDAADAPFGSPSEGRELREAPIQSGSIDADARRRKARGQRHGGESEDKFTAVHGWTLDQKRTGGERHRRTSGAN